MPDRAYVEVFLYVALLAALSEPLGRYIHAVLQARESTQRFGLRAVESSLYRLCRVDPHAQMDWSAYAGRLIVFNLLGALFLYSLQRLQAVLPLNPAHLGAVTADSAFQYRHQLRVQHELAELRPRNYPELRLTDRHHHTIVSFRGDWDLGAYGLRAWF